MILKTCFTIILIILLENIFEAIYKYSDKYKNGLGGADRLLHVPNNIAICNIGSGPGLYAISYENCDKKGFNFSTAPQNYKYGFRILKRFRDKIQKNAIVIIVIMAPLSFANNNDYLRKDYSDKYYGILPKEDIDGYSLKRLMIVLHPLLCKCIRKGIGIFKKVDDNKGDNSIRQNEPDVVKTWKREFELSDLKNANQFCEHKHAFEEKIRILQDGIQFCYENSWRPVLVIPPIPNGTKKYISPEFMNKFVYENVNQLLENNEKLKLLDYFNEELTDDYFQNDIFMNKIGQQYFSNKLFNDIRKSVDEQWNTLN